MINLKNIIGKKVISIYECKEVGQATNVFIAKNWKCEYIEIIHNNIKYILPIRKISAYKDDSIIIRNISALELKSNLELLLQSNISPIDCRVYSLHGKLLGTIVDVAFNDKLYLDSIRLDDGTEYCRSQILKINDGICIIRDSKKIFTSDYMIYLITSPLNKNAFEIYLENLKYFISDANNDIILMKYAYCDFEENKELALLINDFEKEEI